MSDDPQAAEPQPSVSSPPPSPNPAPPAAPDARERLHTLADALVRQRDPHLLRQYLALRSSLR